MIRSLVFCAERCEALAHEHPSDAQSDDRSQMLAQAQRRVDSAREHGREPVRWIAAADVVEQVSDEIGQLAGVPIEVGETRWGLQLVLVRA